MHKHSNGLYDENEWWKIRSQTSRSSLDLKSQGVKKGDKIFIKKLRS